MCRLVIFLLLVVTAVTRRVLLIGMQLSEPLMAYMPTARLLLLTEWWQHTKWYLLSVKMS